MYKKNKFYNKSKKRRSYGNRQYDKKNGYSNRNPDGRGKKYFDKNKFTNKKKFNPRNRNRNKSERYRNKSESVNNSNKSFKKSNKYTNRKSYSNKRGYSDRKSNSNKIYSNKSNTLRKSNTNNKSNSLRKSNKSNSYNNKSNSKSNKSNTLRKSNTDNKSNTLRKSNSYSNKSNTLRKSNSKKSNKKSNSQVELNNESVFDIIESGSEREISENTFKRLPKKNYKDNYKKKDVLVKIKNPKKKKLLDIGIDFILEQNPNLKYKEHIRKKSNYYDLLIIYTRNDNNHPYLIYRNNKRKEIKMLLPLGDGLGHLPFSAIENNIGDFTGTELKILRYYVKKNIEHRRNTLLTSKEFSILHCDNMTGCVRETNKIYKMRISKSERDELISKEKIKYMNKGVKLISKYFELLDSKDYKEAFLFLRGDKGKYFNKTRMNTFFKDNKQIIGHLQVFINLYKLYDKLRNA